MLTGFSCSGYGGSYLFRHGRTALPAQREHLLYRVTSTEQGKPVSLPARGRSTVRWIDGGAGIGIARKRMLPCNRADRGCVASWGQDHLAGNGADFLLVLNSRTLEEPMHEAKQMTTGQPVGAASHTTGGFSTVVRIGSKSVSSRSDSFCIRLRPRFFMGAFLSARAG